MVNIAHFFRSLFSMIVGILDSIVSFIKYIPKLVGIIGYGANEMLSMFNYLPQVLFIVGSIILFIAFWYLIFGR